MSDFIKICPKCDHHNLESANTCTNCGHFLGLVRPRPRPEADHTEKLPRDGETPEKPTVVTPEPTQPVRPSQPARQPVAGQAKIYLESLMNKKLFEVKDGHIVGRADDDGQADVALSDIPGLNFVSREHCRFQFNGEQWHVIALRSAMNGTVLNQKNLNPGEKAPVKAGDTLILANVPFRIRVAKKRK